MKLFCGIDSREAEKQCTEQETVVLFYIVITCISEGYFFISLELAQINSGLNEHTKISIVTIKTYVDHFICENI